MEAGTDEHLLWGESLVSYPDTFLTTVQRHEACQESYDTSELENAVKELQRYTDHLPRSLLERLLLFSQTSRNIEQLLVPEVIPGIMEILETYCEQNKVDQTLFSYTKRILKTTCLS